MSEQSLELPPEPELIQRLINKDEALFVSVVRLWHPALYRVAYSIVGPAIADEVIQEAWLSVINALPTFKQRSSLKTWVTRIVINEAKSRLRKEGRSVSLEALDESWSTDSSLLTDSRFNHKGHWMSTNPAWDISSPDELLAADELQECIEKHLRALPDNQKTILQLKDGADYQMEDICNILEVSSSNARVLLHRARDKIQQVIARFQRTGQC